MEIKNRKASYEYHIIESYVCGLVLYGTEVKSIKSGKCNMVNSYCYFESNELFIKDLDIPIGNTAWQHDQKRNKKLLLNKKELNRLNKNLDKGMTIIPLKIFIKNGWIKIEIALAKGKKLWDKRQSIKENDTKREIARTIKN